MLACSLINSRLDYCKLQLAAVRCSRGYYWQVTKTTKQCSSCTPERQSANGLSNVRPLLRQLHWLPVYANASSTRQRCWRVEWTRLVSRLTWRNTSFNASHLRPAQLRHRYCLSQTWPLISQDVHSHRSYAGWIGVNPRRLKAPKGDELRRNGRISCLYAQSSSSLR